MQQPSVWLHNQLPAAEQDAAACLHHATTTVPPQQLLVLPSDRAPMLQALLEERADPNSTDANGRTPLHVLLQAAALRQLQWGAGHVPANSMQTTQATQWKHRSARQCTGMTLEHHGSQSLRVISTYAAGQRCTTSNHLASSRVGGTHHNMKAVLGSLEQLLLYGADSCRVEGSGVTPMELARTCGEAAGPMLQLLKKAGA